jgi:WD40 repeat protein
MSPKLAPATRDGNAKVIDASDGKEIHHLGGHTNDVLGVAFSLDGRRLATGGFDESIKLRDVSTGPEVLDRATENPKRLSSRSSAHP